MRARRRVLVGCLTDMCVLGTARGAAELGYNTLVVDDACATLTVTVGPNGGVDSWLGTLHVRTLY